MIQVRIKSQSSADVEEIWGEAKAALDESSDIESFERTDRKPRGLSGAEEAVITVITTIATGVTTDMISAYLISKMKSRGDSEAPEIEVTDLEE